MLVVFTAGRYPDQLRQQIQDQSRRLQDKGVEIYVVAIGPDIRPENYYPDFAPRRQNIFNPNTYDNLENERPHLERQIRRGNIIFTLYQSTYICIFLKKHVFPRKVMQMLFTVIINIRIPEFGRFSPTLKCKKFK